MKKAIVFAALAVGAFTGCATNGDIKRLDADLAAVRMEAQDAKRIAEEARRSADEANTRSKATEEMINRSFKKSMYK